MALTQTKKNITNNNLIENQKEVYIYLKKNIFNKGNHPPKNKITIIEDINIILLYSAKKKKVKPIEEYSTL